MEIQELVQLAYFLSYKESEIARVLVLPLHVVKQFTRDQKTTMKSGTFREATLTMLIKGLQGSDCDFLAWRNNHLIPWVKERISIEISEIERQLALEDATGNLKRRKKAETKVKKQLAAQRRKEERDLMFRPKV